jgi:hypothetical protein
VGEHTARGLSSNDGGAVDALPAFLSSSLLPKHCSVGPDFCTLKSLRDPSRLPPSPTHPMPPQAKRLEELDKVYRDEVVARKRAHNALEDAKGKIRVYARVRPLLDFEAAKKQVW